MKTIGDLHRDLEIAFPGKVLGVTNNNGTITVNQYAANTQKAEQDAVKAFIATYDFHTQSRNDLNRDIEAKLKEAANDKSLTDEDCGAYKNKLLRAQHIDDVADKEAKIAEAESIK